MAGEATVETAGSRPRLRLVRPDELPPAVQRARLERNVRRSLSVLAVTVAALTVFGLVMVLSASSITAYTQYGSSFVFFKRQAIFAIAGALAAVVAARIDYHVWQRLWFPLAGVTVLLLAMVLVPSTGVSIAGSSRWIPLGPFSLQPSELAKFVVVAAGAAILTRNHRLVGEPLRMSALLLMLLGGMVGLVMLQPDLGTAMIITGAVFVLLFVSGISLRWLAGAATLVLAGGAGLILSASYRRTRFLAFLHPWSDPHNTGYQTIQGLLALGSGHWFGVGLGASRAAWGYVPNAFTDFIYAIIGEELGLIGAVALLAIFAAMVWAGIRIAIKAPDTYGRLLAAGIIGWLGLQAIINMGTVVGVLPITGVPLPFVSYGGSSLIVSLASVGVLWSIGRSTLAKLTRGQRAARGKGPGRPRRAAPVTAAARPEP